MSQIALRFDAAAAEADAWGDALLGAGALSVDCADGAAGTADEMPLFGEPGEDDPQPRRWTRSELTALLPADADPGQMLAAAARELGLSVPKYRTFAVEDTDWVRATQSQFSPIEITPGLWIVPSWCEPVDERAVNVVLDPGLAFGTGSHPTTRLVLRFLAHRLRRGDSVLDYGCGSGILAISAAKLGAGRVLGVDIDSQAVAASRTNARRNGISARFALPDSPTLRKAAPFDIVVANILANPLRLLAPALAARVRVGGHIVLSGILSQQADDVAAAYQPWIRMTVWSDDEGWVALEGTRQDSRPA